MIPKTHGKKTALKTISMGVSLVSLLFVAEGCSMSSTSANSTTHSTTNSTTAAIAFKGSNSAGKTSSFRPLTVQTSAQKTLGSKSSQTKGSSSSNAKKSGNPANEGFSSTFRMNVSSQNSKDVLALEQFANGIVSKNLGYHVYSVVQANSVLKIEFETNTSQRNQLIQDSYAISSDLAFSITLHQPLVGVNDVDIAAVFQGQPILDYVTPANLMNEWGNNTVSSQYVKSQSQVQAN